MDSGAVDSPVTLVIKAPNQKYEDQTINCFLNWTVEKLKSHISIVYPSRPMSKDQRLVYSGRLLQDHLHLRDVLRKQDQYHMMHLVCTSHSPPGSPVPQSVSMVTSASSDSTGPSSLVNSANQDGQLTSTPSVPGPSNELRYRGGFPQYNPQSFAPMGVPHWPDGAHVSVHMPVHMLWWQQMYARHYYMQYQAAVAASQPPSGLPSPPPSSAHQPVQPNEAVQAPLAPNPLPEDQPVNPNIHMNAQGGAVLNDDDLNRDWLDWLYTVARAGVLLSIVYFYSSFSRFIMVVGAMLLVYLHQAGWFPFRPEQHNVRGGVVQEDADRHQDIQEMERLMDDGMEDDDSDEEGAGGSDHQVQGSAGSAGLPQAGVLTTLWSFIRTFFTSLIPEGRAHPAN